LKRPEFRPFEREHLDGLDEIFRSNVGVWFTKSEQDDLHRHLDMHDQIVAGTHSSAWQSSYETMFIGTEIVGAGGVVSLGEVSELSWGMIHSNFHGQGLGKELLTHRINQVKKEFSESKSILSQTTPSASGFYAKHGFVEKHREPKYWGGELELVGLEMSLDGNSRYKRPE
jgi:GNAT superfamily N-acetyltransferase